MFAGRRKPRPQAQKNVTHSPENGVSGVEIPSVPEIEKGITILPDKNGVVLPEKKVDDVKKETSPPENGTTFISENGLTSKEEKNESVTSKF